MEPIFYFEKRQLDLEPSSTRIIIEQGNNSLIMDHHNIYSHSEILKNIDPSMIPSTNQIINDMKIGF